MKDFIKASERIEFAEKHGWKVAGDPRHNMSLKKGDVHIWLTRDGYVIATLIDEHFRNHKITKNFIELIEQGYDYFEGKNPFGYTSHYPGIPIYK